MCDRCVELSGRANWTPQISDRLPLVSEFEGIAPIEAQKAAPAEVPMGLLAQPGAPAPAPAPERRVVADAPTVNPKALAGAKKPATWSVMPRWIMALVGRVMSVGAAKYEAFNYRQSRIAASTYEDAIERHCLLWFDGEDDDPETGVSHLASVMASCALLIDAQATGKLDDDRQKTGNARKALDALQALLTTLPLPARTQLA